MTRIKGKKQQRKKHKKTHQQLKNLKINKGKQRNKTKTKQKPTNKQTKSPHQIVSLRRNLAQAVRESKQTLYTERSRALSIHFHTAQSDSYVIRYLCNGWFDSEFVYVSKNKFPCKLFWGCMKRGGEGGEVISFHLQFSILPTEKQTVHR